MIEPLFGSPSPTWAAVPSPMLGWQQAPVPPGGHSIGGPPGLGSPHVPSMTPGGMAVGQTPLTPMAFAQPGLMMNSGFGFPIVQGPFGTYSAFPGLVSPEIAVSSSIRALLEAVAMRRGQPLTMSNDQECEDLVYDALEMLPGANEVDVRCENGRLTLTGNVQHKRLKHDIGELAWTLPVVNDVQNNITIVTRRRARSAARDESHSTPPGAGRKPA